ncbi:hypothetical protein A1OQ_09165 [Enterovibrio norvegicus FF-162]|uniref:antiviral reverse transcriptase Drt3b n=1 Tax=Enterovibrio norvegicus TaxID=188144 RepID=UPI0003069895|nr:antiviral reverse transcriptase Drt3b [Enterovibrio norvegicus]OEE74427.1 hypothetical protein A1OQ_09165 [Enterovibrio norvegicus FF-162]
MPKYKIERNDTNRVILTEVLPYELPLTYSNECLYNLLKIKESNTIPKIVKILYEDKGYTIPFDYNIRKSKNKNRKLSLIHPSAQCSFAGFYAEYETLILNQCQKSKFSLRYPSSIASRYYERDLVNLNEDEMKTPHVDSELNGFAEQSKFASSYFTYKKYSFLYKFYDSYEFHRLEKKFNYLLKFDISKCFHSIYTHSISWAVKDKHFAKENQKCESFENVFDKLMQKSNFNETNGIVVGPEVSRIFAEIILQSIDDSVRAKLEEEGNYLNSDYVVKRYVDDFFVFTNSKTLAESIKLTFISEMEKFKLYVNDSKTEIMEVPYISNLSIAKHEIKKILADKFTSLHSEQNKTIKDDEDDIEDDVFSIKLISSPSRQANYLIRDLKCIIKSNEISYESISGYIIGTIRKNLKSIIDEYIAVKERDDNEQKALFNLLYLLLDVTFFVYSMDCRVRTTYLIAQFIVILDSIKGVIPNHYIEVLEKKIFDESMLVIRKSNDSNLNAVEVINLLISLKTLSGEYRIPEKTLSSIFPSLDKIDRWDYFLITTILFYIGDNKEYSNMRKSVVNIVIQKFKNKRNPLIDTQYTCMLFDFMSCPFIEDDKKLELLRIAHQKCGISFSTDSIFKTLSFVKKIDWFTCWDARNIQLAKILMKKELRSIYE